MTAMPVPGQPSKGRRSALRTVLVLLSLPVVLVFIEAGSYYASNRTNAIVASGQKREYLLYVPKSYDRAKATPLVISMHGAAGRPAQQMNLSGWNRLAEAERFIVVYPAGASGPGPRIWHMEGGAALTNDVRFIAALIDTLKAAYNIDPMRIYANGLSAGGGMAFVLSCTLSDRIAAFGMVAAAQLMPWSRCLDHRPVPVIAFHGTADPATPYHGGRTWIAREPFPSIPAWTANWARRNRCEPDPVESAIAADVTRREYSHCADSATVVLYTVQGGGHTWPGGTPMPERMVGPTSTSIDATTQMWTFFRNHPLRPTPAPPR